MSDEILTVQEVAALLKVADKTVYPIAQRGRCQPSGSENSAASGARTSTHDGSLSRLAATRARVAVMTDALSRAALAVITPQGLQSP